MLVAAPALHGPVPHQRARIRKARGDGNHAGEPGYYNRRRRVGGAAVAQLTVMVVAPALDGPAR